MTTPPGHRGQHFFCSYPCTFPTLATIHSMDTLFYHHRIFFTFCTFFLLCVVMIITYAKWFKKWRIINYNELKRIHLESLLILIRIISWLLRKLKSIFIFHFLGDNSSNEKKNIVCVNYRNLILYRISFCKIVLNAYEMKIFPLDFTVTNKFLEEW